MDATNPVILGFRDFKPDLFQVSFDDTSGFPFDDEDVRRPNLRSYFDNVTSRHPEFADWGEEFPGFGKKRRGSGSGEDHTAASTANTTASASQQTPQTATTAAAGSDQQQGEDQTDKPKPNLSQYGLRNTVPLIQGLQNEEDRRPRSMSAPPPDSRNNTQPQHQQKRFISKCEIPLVHDPTAKPPMAPKTEEQGKTVRVIPIVVEGRTEPLINKDLEKDVGPERTSSPFEGRLPREFGNYQKQSPRFSTAQSAPPPPSQHQPQPQACPTPPPPTPPPPQQPEVRNINDPLIKVQLVQKELESLHQQVSDYKGASRSDKDYVYLDEMLTRNLIKLDDIETDGKEEVRLARKDAIKGIQRCISMLENKVPLGNKHNEENTQMEVDKTKENTPEVAEQSMEVEQINQPIPLPDSQTNI